jgi:stage IV sporulation protein FB
MKIGKLTVRAGFVLLVTVLVYLDQGGLLWVVFAAALLHELGHYIPLRLLGGRVSNVELTGGGVGMEAAQPMSYKREVVTVLGGPIASLAFALLFSLRDGIIEGQAAIAGMCFSHAIFNMLPMRGLDGGRVLELILSYCGVERGRTIIYISTAITALALGLLCGIMAVRHKNISMLLALIYVATSALHKKKDIPRRAAQE